MHGVIMAMVMLHAQMMAVACLSYQTQAAIQQSQEVYCSYLPLISDCDYNNSGILPGTVEITPLTAQYMFNQIDYEDQISFWSPVRNGLSIAVMLQDYLLNSSYNGFIYYSSQVLSDNRMMIFYSVGAQGQLYFTYCELNITVEAMQISQSANNPIKVLLIPQAQDIVTKCAIGKQSINYVGEGVFLFLCLDSANLAFLFNPSLIFENGVVVDFDGLGEIVNVTTNPELLDASSFNDDPFDDDSGWDLIVLCLQANDSSPHTSLSYLLDFDTKSGEYSWVSLTQEQDLMKIVIDRIWGTAELAQVPKWNEVLDAVNSMNQEPYSIPGYVTSMFISTLNNIYVESSTGLVNYLIIISERSGELIANISYKGSIVFYGHENVFFYDNITEMYKKIDVVRPIFQIYNKEDKDTDSYTNLTLTLQCSESIVTLNYSILWTSNNYPSALIVPLSNDSIFSDTPIYEMRVGDRYAVFGPDLEIYINSSLTLNSTVIDSNSFKINTNYISLISAQSRQGFFKLILALSEGFYEYQIANNRMRPVFTAPCGFSNITSITKLTDKQILVNNGNGKRCICDMFLKDCSEIPLSASAHSHLEFESEERYHPQGLLNTLLSSSRTDGVVMRGEAYEIKVNLFALLKDGYLVSILVNNSIILTDLKTKQVLDMVSLECSGSNQTNGNIYMRQFYDPFLLLFCEEREQIVEFIIRGNKFLFERDIPIYGFRTREDGSNFLIGINYIFLSVDPFTNQYPLNPYCCVLRLDPCEYTVSVIQEIIYANNIQTVKSLDNSDIVIFNQAGSPNISELRIYYADTIVALQQLLLNQSQVTENFDLVFKSSYYNFAADFTTTITFNFSQAQISLNNVEEPYVMNFEQFQSNYDTTIFNTTDTYNLNQFCGPVFNTVFLYNISLNDSQMFIQQVEVLTHTKSIGKAGLQYIQIINPEVFGVKELSLNFLMIFISMNEMFIYDKYYQNIDLYFLTSIPLPEVGCTYYVYEIVNASAATFISNCINSVDVSSLVPIFTISYDSGSGKIGIDYSWFLMPIVMKEIFTIVRGLNQTSLFVGIQEGPMKSATGKLFICEEKLCQPLYISSRIKFLINYGALNSIPNYFIMTIDYFLIQIFINPAVVGNTIPSPANYTIHYNDYIDEKYCSALRILTANFTAATIMLSCDNYYYYLDVDYQAAALTILMKFERYSQCSYLDMFRPDVVVSGGQIQVMYAVCSQNQATLKYETFKTLDSSPTIYTGFLQIFTLQGPSCQPNVYSPIKIIPLSSSMEYSLFANYQSNTRNKFIYCEINGFLIDNLVNIQPYFSVTFTPLESNFDMPNLYFIISNPFEDLERSISVVVSIYEPPSPITYLLVAIFFLLSLLTVACMVSARIHKKQRNKVFMFRDSNFSSSSGVNELMYDDTVRAMRDRMETGGNSVYSEKPVGKKPRVSEIELFFFKK